MAHLHLADQIAATAARHYRGLLDPDDLVQIAREALLHYATRCHQSQPPEPYLRRCITGAIQHHIRDGVRLVRVSRRAHERGHWPLSHVSLDAPHPGGGGSWLDQLPAASAPAWIPSPASVLTPTDCSPDATGSTDDTLIDALLDQLPAPQAAALRLTLLQGYSIRSAASALGISATSIHRLRNTALRSLRAQALAA